MPLSTLSRSWSWRTRWGSTCGTLPLPRTCSTAGSKLWQLLRLQIRSWTWLEPETGTGRGQRHIRRKLGQFSKGWERNFLWIKPLVLHHICMFGPHKKCIQVDHRGVFSFSIGHFEENVSSWLQFYNKIRGMAFFWKLNSLQGDRGSQSWDWASEGEEGGGISEASYF